MAKRTRFDQLDDAVQAMLSRPDAAPPAVDADLAPLLQIAAQLRDLPREGFKAKLKQEFARRKPMATLAEPVAAARQAVTAYLTVKDAASAIDFYKRAFGAQEIMRLVEPSGKVGHAQIVIGGSTIMLADEYPDYGAVSPQTLGGSPVKLNLSVPDVDEFARQAVAAGAKIARPIADQFYGERSGQISDPFGYTWIVATHTEDMSATEMQRRFEEATKPAEPKTPGVDPIRKGFRTVTPYLSAPDGAALLDFAKNVFGAEEIFRSTGSAGGIHGEVRLGDTMLMMGGGIPGKAWKATPNTAALHVYVPDCDATYQRALEAGATSIDVPTDQDYGERSCTVKDFAGNFWYIATYKGPNYKWEGAPDVQPCMHPRRADTVINFLKRAFGAEEVGRHATPDGVIQHATMRIGTSLMELGDAHGPYQPMNSMFYLYVPDVDALYRRALAAGARSIGEPTDQDYGDRNAAVEDPFGNQWYIATHIKDVTP
jgi:PhnB protein